MKTIAGVLWAVAIAVFSTASNAAIVDGEPTFTAQSKAGLYVWRSSNGLWHSRLLAGGTGQLTFQGSFQTTGAIDAVQGESLEADDTVQLTSAGLLKLSLKVGGQWTDGLSFRLSGSGLCLYEELPGNIPIYLGKYGTTRMAPVDLGGAGDCSNAAGPVSYEPTPDQGLYASRLEKTVWEFRLSALSEPQSFEGYIEVSAPIVGYRLNSVEVWDSVYLANTNRLNFSLKVGANSYDVVTVTVPEFSSVCLRLSSGAKRSIFLGNMPEDAAPAVTPVDLTNSGACGVAPPWKPSGAETRKYHPGHYTALVRGNDSQAVMASSVMPGMAGFLKRYTWRELEPTRGHYNFSEIESDLAFAASQGMQLIAMIEDKTFSAEMPTPDYLASLTFPNIPGGYTVARWDDYVISRFNALTKALGQRFDTHPSFEGIALQESAAGIYGDPLVTTAYTPEKYRDALINILLTAGKNLPRSRIFWYMNFLEGRQFYLGQIARAVTDVPNAGIVMGGPDLMPDHAQLQLHTYPFYDAFSGKLPLFLQVEGTCYFHEHAEAGAHPYWSPQELFEYGRDHLHLNYIFWVRVYKEKYPESYDWFDTLPVMQTYPRIN